MPGEGGSGGGGRGGAGGGGCGGEGGSTERSTATYLDDWSSCWSEAGSSPVESSQVAQVNGTSCCPLTAALRSELIGSPLPSTARLNRSVRGPPPPARETSAPESSSLDSTTPSGVSLSMT